MKTGDKRKWASVLLLIFLIFYVGFYQVYLLKHALKYADTITVAVLIFVTFIAFLFLGFRRDKTKYFKKEVLKTTLIIVLMYYVGIYGLGLALGFLKNGYSLNIPSLLNNMLAPVILVVSSEILRYIIINNNQETENKNYSRFMIAFVTVVLFLVDLNPQISARMFTSNMQAFNIITSIVIPALIKSIMLSYLTYNLGYKTSLVYRLCMDLTIYFMPMFPDLSDYIKSMLGILVPFLVYIYASRIITGHDEQTKEEKNEEKKIGIHVAFYDVGVIAVAVLLIGLISTQFPYYLLGIATGSMEPKINVGDAVMAHKVSNDDELKTGDVIIFEKKGVRVVHRIAKIGKDKDGNIVYTTKGDANSSDDGNEITIDEIDAKVLFKIPLIGYPTVWASQLLG